MATSSRAGRRHAGISLVEVMLVVVMIGILAALAVPATDHWFESQRLRSSAREVAAALAHARGEAIRTGNIHIVFFQEDAETNTLTDPNGATVPILVVDDGRAGTVDQNCKVDAGEAVQGYGLETGVSFGVTNAASKAPNDSGGGSKSTGSTFLDAGGNAATWVLFRPEGTPLAFSSDCSTGTVGSGAGGVYLTNGARDSAVVLTPLGGTRAHTADPSGAGWSS